MHGHLEIIPEPGRSLADRLFDLGVEFPCGGESACGGCRIRVLSGDVPVTPMMRQALSEVEIAAGWRLACCAESAGPVTVEVEQWSVRVLSDEARVAAEPRDGFGLAIDLGTTTLVAQLVDLAAGEVAATETALNNQARFGADVMSRIQFDLREPGALTRLVRAQLGEMAARVAAGRHVRETVVAGNTVMHHLFCGLSVEPLAAVPFRSPDLGTRILDPRELSWPANIAGQVEVAACLGGFVGGDILAGLVATGFLEPGPVRALMDLGTNGEIAVTDGRRLFCASTAAGPAFEGGRIGAGMRAGAGAIDGVHLRGGAYACHVIGGGAPRGLCGSGLVDAASCALAAGDLLPSGRLANGSKSLPLVSEVSLSQRDFRELQLAKGAMASGLLLLAARFTRPVERLFLAGAFGNYIRVASARAIGLLPEEIPVDPAGNTALRGARMMLAAPRRRAALTRAFQDASTHVELASEPGFEDRFAAAMSLAPFRLS